jgi:hypothetical protein
MRNIFMQQWLEGTLRETLGQRASVVLRQGHEMLELKQNGQGVTLQVRDAQDEIYQLRADYVIGADGGRSTVRKKLGIELSRLTHARKWVVVDTANDTLDAPYTALHGLDLLEKCFCAFALVLCLRRIGFQRPFLSVMGGVEFVQGRAPLVRRLSGFRRSGPFSDSVSRQPAMLGYLVGRELSRKYIRRFFPNISMLINLCPSARKLSRSS